MPAAKWGAVYEFAAQIAERANHAEQAAQHYEREIADGGVADKDRRALQDKITDLRNKSAVEDAATAAVQKSSAPSAPLEEFFALLGVKPGTLKHQIKIAIINPPPSSIKKDDDPMHDYVESIEAVVRAIAPMQRSSMDGRGRRTNSRPWIHSSVRFVTPKARART